ncbi:MAG TPA: serine/threonine-protein kinase [Polyangiaceae bacterium]|nr:serine/threonine-protein kinase [Polyangiaceae bacterium]
MTQEATGADLAPGRLIAGRFRLERLLGKGGMGSVWVARHLNLNVDVALKFIDPAVAKRDDVASRFAQEAQAAAKVKSPHVVNILDYGTDAFGRAYIAMELLQGEELAQRLDRFARMPLPDVCRIVVHACRGLGRAHAAGIVHRDLKPENLFLVEDDEGFITKVLDFGIAKASSPVGLVTHHTGTGQILGTPLFMSPEQALGRADIDFRSDLYSLAVVAFRCLTGVVPFETNALGELIVKVSTEPVPSARALRPELPPAVDEWFKRAMHKDPAQRFASAREMSETFLQACDLSAGGYASTAPPPNSIALRAATASSLPGEPVPAATAATAAPAAAAAPPRAETLMGATATYTPPAIRPWVSYVAAALCAGLLLGALLFFRGGGGGGGAGEARPARDKVALPAAQPPRPGGAAPKASAPAAPTVEPAADRPAPSAAAPPPPEPPKAEAEGRDEAAAETPARRRAPRATPSGRAPSPKGPNAPPKPASIDWGIE